MESKVTEALKNCSKDEASYKKLKELFEEQEQKAKETEKRLNLLEAAIRNDYDSILITELELEKPGPRIVYVNNGFEKLSGYSKEEVIGKTPRILQGPKTDREILDRLKKNLKKGKAFFGQAVNYRKDGSEFIMQWDIHPLRDKEGKITHWVSYQHDITKRKRAEERLVNTQIEFDEMDEESKRTLVDVGDNGNIVMANKAFRDLVGYELDELQKMKVWDLLPRNFKHSLHGRFEHAIKQEDFNNRSYRVLVKHKSGTPLQVEINTKLMKLKNKTLIRADIKNISLQKKVLRKLNKRNTKFDKIFKQATDFTYHLKQDEKGQFYLDFLSESFPELTGYYIDEFLGKDGWRKLIHPDDMDKARQHIQRVLNGKSSTSEYRIVNKDGDFIQIMDYARPLTEPETNEIIGVRGAVTVELSEEQPS